MKYIKTGSFKRLFSLRRRSIDQSEPDKCYDHDQSDKGIGRLGFEDIALPQKPVWRCFSYEEIYSATNGFSSENLVGRGGYAEVYRGTLLNGNRVAVKKLTKASTDERREREFLTELGTIGHVSHPNVSSLSGCCIDNGLFLIFPLSSGGSVASRLHDDNLPVLEWEKRYKIAVGTARGLHYLHKGCQRRIIHRDIKASNILLSEDYEPLISDFGLAKWLPTQWTHHSVVPIEGTVGYLAPEYFSHGMVDEKTDVYAFGVFLLELISGKRPVDSSHQSLRSWAKPFLQQGQIEILIDPKLENDYDESELRRVALAASLCTRSSSNWRPTMSEALELMLEGEVDIQRWEIPEKEEEQDDAFWDFEDLEYECDSSFSTTIHENSISTECS
ncbi:hypothetical protein V2J09_010260 [Rumex salicifolius]